MNLKSQKFIILIACLCLFFPINAYGQSQDGSSGSFAVGKEAFDNGSYDVAIAQLESYLAFDVEADYSIQSRIILGQAYYHIKNYVKALSQLRAVLDTIPPHKLRYRHRRGIG